jgi:Icc-related predicted phosphoesterase
VPIIATGNNRYRAHVNGHSQELGAEELDACRHSIRERGLYPFVTDQDELAELNAAPEKLERLFHRSILETVESWLEVADEKLRDSGKQCVVCPGNDDIPEVDAVLAESGTVHVGEGRVVRIGDYELVSTGWSNPTPWETYREEPEERLATRIQDMLQKITAPPERVIFNFHCPPYGTPLDEAPELTEDLDVVGAGRSLAHVGSTAVREAIDEVQPLMSLHGHIHESRATTRLGRTLAVNPGSSYEQGVLLGAVLEVDGGGRLNRYQLTSG